MAYLNILIPFLCALFNIVAQVFSYKFISKNMLLKSVYSGFLAGLAVFITYEFFIYAQPFSEWLSFFLVNLIIYGCLSYCYFTFINMGETARRIRLLRKLYDYPAGLTKAEVLSDYNAQEIIDLRLTRLIRNKQIILQNSKYYIGNISMLIISKAIEALKIIILGKKSEFKYPV